MISFDDIPESAYDSVIRELFGDRALHEKNTEYNFVCPNCGDMAYPNKRKAYIYKNSWQFLCYKCTEATHFMYFLKDNYPEHYRRLLFYGIDHSIEPSEKKKEVHKKEFSGLPFSDGELVPLTSNNPLAKQGLELCRHRRIREELLEQWYVCLEGDQFFKRDNNGAYIINPNTHKPYGNEYKNRIIIPFYRFGGNWTQFDARAIDPNNELRYRNFEGAKRTAYNIDFINFQKPFYILEGTIDSTFIHNSISIGGTKHLSEVLEDNPEIEKHKDNCVMLWDNDDPGRNAMWDTIKKGFKWFDWNGIKAKDVNGAIMDGEFPVDKHGFLDQSVLESRTRNVGTAGISFVLEYGNVGKRAYKEKMDAKRKLEASRAKIGAKVFF